MNILLLENRGDKQQKVLKALEGNEADLCCCVTDFKRDVKKKKYDLIIVDIFVPFENGSKDNENGGYAAIEYIRKTTDDIYRPSGMLVLSAYLDDDRIVKLNNYNVKGIKFDEDGAWEDELLSEVEQVRLTLQKKYDVLLITAVDVEMEQTKWALPACKRLDCADEEIYYSTTITNMKKEEISIVLCQQIRKGMVAAAHLTTKAIDLFNPDCVIMLGIAGGNIKDVSLGDIVVASDAIDYCSGSIEENGEEVDFLPDAQIISAPKTIMRLFRQYKGDTELLRKIRDDCGDLKENRDISLFVGKMATGPAVIKSKKFADTYLKRHNRDYRAIDMETFGVYFSARYSQNPNIQFISVKSISDGADKDKSDTYQKYCSRLVANLVKHYLENDYQKVYN